MISLSKALKAGSRRLRPAISESQVPAALTRQIHNIREENINRYTVGGYHPVRIGDEFNKGRYKVINKLGYGQYSTVWLARNTLTNEHVALKILTADSFGGAKDTFELDLLQHIKACCNAAGANPATHHILNLRDEFQHSGPNGKHVCLVFKATGPDMLTFRRLFPRLKIPIPLAKVISKQLLMALAFLHDTCKVIHADIKPGNILVETTEINDMLEHAPSAVLAHQSPVLNPPDDFYMESEQVSSAAEDLTRSKNVCVRLADFGTSSWFENHLTEWIQPQMLRAPEVILGAQWDYKVDIWNLGLIIWELVQGQLVFDGQASARAPYSSAAHLAQMVSFFGSFPKTLLDRSKHTDAYFDFDGNLLGDVSFRPRSLRELSKELKCPEEEQDDFMDFIESMVSLEPTPRLDARELLKAKWLADA